MSATNLKIEDSLGKSNDIFLAFQYIQ